MEIGPREHAAALYYHIAGDALKCARKEANNGKDEFCLAQYVCASMVFSALTLEAYINQEYTLHLPTSRIKVEQLNTHNKWTKLPLLLGNCTTFNNHKAPYPTFTELVYLRNNVLVHFKGGPINNTETTKPSSVVKPFSVIVKDWERANNYFECIAAMIKQLNALTSGQTSLPGFLTGERYLATFAVDMPYGIDII